MGEILFYERLMSCRRDGETFRAFAQRAGISYGSLRAYRRGRMPWILPTVVEIGRNLNIDPIWLGCLKEDVVRRPFAGESTN